MQCDSIAMDSISGRGRLTGDTGRDQTVLLPPWMSSVPSPASIMSLPPPPHTVSARDRGVLPAGDHARVHRIHYRFGVVLCLILATITFTLAAPEGDGARFVAVMLQAAVLVAAVIASRAHRYVIELSVVAAAVGIAGTAAALFGSGQFGNSSAAVVALFYVMLTPPAIVMGLMKQFREAEAVTLQTMFGVLCLYLLVGLLFSVTFVAVDQLSDTAFFTKSSVHGRDDFLYFSYTTLTTVGYGDLVAATNLGRSLAITEALLGQLYLVSVVAVIISNLRPAKPRPRRRDRTT